MKIHWGKGYVTEAARACIQYGFEPLQIKTIVRKTLMENMASLRVLEKCGMNYTGLQEVDGNIMKVSRIDHHLHHHIRP